MPTGTRWSSGSPCLRRRTRISRVRVAILVLALLAVSPAAAQEETDAPLPFTLPTPDGWREETIPFPLGFAPGLEYEGLEALRFAPGMFDPDSETYWTYAFVWWVSVAADLNADTLARDLEAYFRGLTKAVAETNEFDPGPVVHTAVLDPVDTSDGRRLSGRIDTYDPFATRRSVTLNARVEIRTCAKNRVAIFELSPRAFDHEVWKVLAGIRTGFRCDGG